MDCSKPAVSTVKPCSAATQAGWGRKRSEAALAPGTEVTLTIAPSFAGTPVGLVNKITGAQGENILGMGANVFTTEEGGSGKKQ